MRPRHPAPLVLAALVLWLLLGLDGRLHWDEPQYLYAGAYVPLAEIVAGRFEPSGIAGFNVSRIALLLLIDGISALVGVGGQLIAVVMALHVALLLAFFAMLRAILGELTVAPGEATLATVTVMVSPIALYLAFKTLPDTPALATSTLAVLALLRLARRRRVWLWFTIGALALALAALTKHVLIWTFVAFVAAALIARPADLARGRLLAMAGALAAGSIALFAATLAALGLDPADFLAFLRVASAAAEPLAARGLHLLIALGALWILVAIAAFPPHRPLTRFFWLWFAVAALPFLLLVPRLEIRYLAPALLPLAGVVAVALDRLQRHLPRRWSQRRSQLTLLVLVATIGLSSRAVQGLTGHEVEIGALHTLLRRLDATFGADAYAVVTPWEYSTFLYLRIAYPALPVYDAYDPARAGGRPDAVLDRERHFAGHLLRDLDQLRAVDAPVVYLGFVEAMPIANLRRLAQALPGGIGEPLLRRLDALDTLKHLTLSWMWTAPELSFAPLDQEGNYLAYRVKLDQTVPPADEP